MDRLRRLLFSLQYGAAQRVIFYYPGEEPTYLEDAEVTVFRNGCVDVRHRQEHVCTHIQNVEILWRSRPGTQVSGPGRQLTLVKSGESSSK